MIRMGVSDEENKRFGFFGHCWKKRKPGLMVVFWKERRKWSLEK